MANISGTNLAAGIAPFTTDDKYATHYAEYGKGGWHSVATISDRDAIPVQRRETGMVVFVQAENIPYRLAADGSWERLLNDVDDSLSSTSKNPIQNCVVYEEITKVNTSLSTKQGKTDDSLKTTNKTVVGAVNEVHDKLNELVKVFTIDFQDTREIVQMHTFIGQKLTHIKTSNVTTLCLIINDSLHAIQLTNGEWKGEITVASGALLVWQIGRTSEGSIAEISVQYQYNS